MVRLLGQLLHIARARDLDRRAGPHRASRCLSGQLRCTERPVPGRRAPLREDRLPSLGRAERQRRAHQYVARQFRAAGLNVEVDPFRVPRRGQSRKRDRQARSARKLPGHPHVPHRQRPPGARSDRQRLRASASWSVSHQDLPPSTRRATSGWSATGSEERQVTGLSYHAGAAGARRAGQVRGHGSGPSLRALARRGRPRQALLPGAHRRPRFAAESRGRSWRASRRAGVTVDWARDSGTGNSDHREFELAGLPGAVVEVWRCLRLPPHGVRPPSAPSKTGNEEGAGNRPGGREGRLIGC